MVFARWDFAFVLAALHLKHVLVLSKNTYLCFCVEQRDCKIFCLSDIWEMPNEPLLYEEKVHLLLLFSKRRDKA